MDVSQFSISESCSVVFLVLIVLEIMNVVERLSRSSTNKVTCEHLNASATSLVLQ
jgi:hypothetical protein